MGGCLSKVIGKSGEPKGSTHSGEITVNSPEEATAPNTDNEEFKAVDIPILINEDSTSESESFVTDIEEDNPPNRSSLSPQRLRAEKKFKSAAKKLLKAIPSEDNNPLQFPDAISLDVVDSVEDVEGTGRLL